MEAEPLLSIVPKIDLGPVDVESSSLSPQSSSPQPGIVGAALVNLGNTCFLNAVLQCLTHTVPLAQRIFEADHRCSRCGDDEGFCSFSALKDHIKHCVLSSGFVVSPEKFAENLSKISPCLQLGQQEDAHEFLRSLLDCMHTCCLDRSIKDHPSSFDEDSLVRQVFGGRLRSQLRCGACGHCSDTFEPILDLSLEINDVDSIRDALISFTKVEKIEDPEIKFTCDGCKAQVSMEKQLKLHQAPEVVALHLKRFKNNGFFSDKISKHVEYPLELDLKDFLSRPEEEVQLKYDLYAVVVHIGSSYSGHYFCYICSSPNTWHRMDDSTITRVSESHVLEQTAYILLYMKKGSSCWFSSLMEAEKIRCLDVAVDTNPTSVLDHVERDLGSILAGEASCISSYNKASPIIPTVDASLDEARYRAASSPCCGSSYDHTADNAVAGRFLTQPTLRSNDQVSNKTKVNNLRAQSQRKPMSDLLTIDMFEDEYLGDEENHHLNPQVQVQLKGTKGLGRLAPEAMKDARINEPFNRMVRVMPRHRRDSILACLASQSKSLQKKPQTIGSKRRLL